MKTEAAYLKAAFMKVEPKFDIEKTDKAILNSLLAWVWRKEWLNILQLDFSKGFCLYMNGVVQRHDSKKGDYRLCAWMKSASELANTYAADGQPALIQYAGADVNLVIDEFGREPCPTKYFGTEMNVLQFLLQLRYDHRKTSVTHITTNMQLEDIADRYGAYVADRCLEMFNFIEFKGESYRQ